MWVPQLLLPRLVASQQLALWMLLASRMLLLAHAATEYEAPASSPGGHAQD
jgi:hypothetical protein